MKHEKTKMVRLKPNDDVMFTMVYVGKGWKALFECPVCYRRTWQHLNFLGGKIPCCDGEKITKEKRGYQYLVL